MFTSLIGMMVSTVMIILQIMFSANMEGLLFDSDSLIFKVLPDFSLRTCINLHGNIIIIITIINSCYSYMRHPLKLFSISNKLWL